MVNTKKNRKLKPQLKVYCDEYYINLYQELLNGERKKLHCFWNKDVAILITRHVINDVLRWSREDICNNFVKQKIAHKYMLRGANREFGNSNYTLLSNSFPEYKIYPWELVGGSVSNSYWRDDNNKRTALLWFVNKLLEEGIISDIEELPYKVQQKTFNKYRIRGLVANYFDDSTYKTINFLYPNKFKKWQFFNMRGLNKEEVLESVRWLFLDKLKLDIKEIPFYARNDLFDKYKLMAGITKYFRSYKITIIEAFPEAEFHYWDFRQMEQNFWLKKANREKILKEFIKDDLKISIEETPKFFNLEYLTEHDKNNFVVACYRYYESFYDWFNQVFPNVFTESEYNAIAFKNRPSREFDSLGEYQIYYHIKNNMGIEIEYCGRNRKHKLHNSSENENYIPDFIINNNIICEFYGFYTPRPTTDYFKDYIKKTNRKNIFYKNYCKRKGLFFLELYNEDLNNNFKGLELKLNEIIPLTNQ